jgi:hypothetical protein
MDFKEVNMKVGLDSVGFIKGRVAPFCENGSAPLDSIKDWE